jgi:endogenous inhibitor of DNA gyrase (YacG/DUF329 family)
MPKPSANRIQCPTCGRRGRWFDGPFGPFCSKRCRLIDLGKWLGEEHRFSEPLRPELFDPYADLPSGPELDQPDHET